MGAAMLLFEPITALCPTPFRNGYNDFVFPLFVLTLHVSFVCSFGIAYNLSQSSNPFYLCSDQPSLTANSTKRQLINMEWSLRGWAVGHRF